MMPDEYRDILKQMTILYAEDQDFIRNQLVMLLEEKINKIYTASDGVEALKLFKEIHPDIVISDIEMPNMDGLELAVYIKELNRDVPFIVTTAHDDTHYLLKAFDVGVDNFLTKPVSGHKLFEMVGKYGLHLNRKRELDNIRKRLQNIANGMGEGLLVVDQDGDLTYINQAAENIMNVSLEKGRPENIRSFIKTKQSVTAEMILSNVIDSGRSFSHNNTQIIVNAEERVISFTASPLVENGIISGAVIVFRDITEEKEKDDQIRMLSQAVETTHSAISLNSMEGDFLFVNRGFLGLSGFNSFKKVQSKSFFELITIEGRADFKEVLVKSLKKKGKWNGEVEFIRSDNNTLPVEIESSVIEGEGESTEKFIASIHDISERKNAEKERIKSKSQEIELYKFRERYHSLQQEYAFRKQSKIINDHLCCKMVDNLYIETFFKPLDVLSGDIYGTIDGGNGKLVLYIIDAMGKGLSASVTSTQSCSFVNHSFDRAFQSKDFVFKNNVKSYVSYIQKQLLDDELVCALFMFLDLKNDKVEIANFGMPPMLIELIDEAVSTVPSNNPPIMKFFTTSDMVEYNLSDISKIMMHSDGLDEHLTKEGDLYSDKIQNDFIHSITKKDFLSRFNKHIKDLKDDISFIFINRYDYNVIFKESLVFKTELSLIEKVMARLIEIISEMNIMDDMIENYYFSLNELFMNAIEHGNLGISYEMKQKLMEEGKFDDFLMEQLSNEEMKNKEINVDIIGYETLKSRKILEVKITDCGNGFDSAEVFKNLNFSEDMLRYHGRGIAMSQIMVNGIFFNLKGNQVSVILHEKE